MKYSLEIIVIIATILQFCSAFTVFNTKKLKNRDEIPLNLAFEHKKQEKFVKRLEYDAENNIVDDNLAFGLVPFDLNSITNDAFAYDVEQGVEETLDIIEGEVEKNPTTNPNAEAALDKKTMNALLMHQGFYDQAPEYNAIIDGLIQNVQRDFERRHMDPLYFTVHDRGVIRHTKINKPTTTQSPAEFTTQNSAQNNVLGGGDIKGLLKLRRFGNAESRQDGEVILVRSHYFFGPLEIDLLFESNRGIRIINSTLSSLAAHALYEIRKTADNTTITLREFVTDSPMEYAIHVEGTRSKRYKRLSLTAIMRLFKRNNRLEVRILRSFRRAATKPIRNIKNNNQRNTEQLSKNANSKQIPGAEPIYPR